MQLNQVAEIYITYDTLLQEFHYYFWAQIKFKTRISTIILLLLLSGDRDILDLSFLTGCIFCPKRRPCCPCCQHGTAWLATTDTHSRPSTQLGHFLSPESEREQSVCVCVCVCEYTVDTCMGASLSASFQRWSLSSHKKWVCVCVCVRERERERECVCVWIADFFKHYPTAIAV